MNGQWTGQYIGSTGGSIIVNIDEREEFYQGVAYLLPNDKTLPVSVATFRTRDKTSQFKVRTLSIYPIDPMSGNIAPWAQVKSHYPNTQDFSNYADVVGTWTNELLKLSWTSDLGAAGSCELPRSEAAKPSKLVPKELDWTGYKAYVATLKMGQHLFRGQRKPWRLRTSFHRSGRADLNRYQIEDVPVLRRHLSGKLKRLFDVNNAEELGAFYTTLQHHGYPTPLLDWTYSPYVAAFFAYREIPNRSAAEARTDAKVRIYVFDQLQWKADLGQISQIIHFGLHVSIGEFMAIENDRLIPQQAASTVTNVDDVETYITFAESETKRNYLAAVDLPVSQRKQVIGELSYMGITAGSMFPGLDGACEELRERNFEL